MKHAVNLVSEDGIRLNAIYFQGQAEAAKDTCIVVVPGFAQHSGTQTMTEICEFIADEGEVICIDLRGTGKSGGGHYFGAQEYLDVKAAIQWAEARYTKIFLLGFSLGAYSALRAATAFKHKLQHLFLISCPTSVDEIIWGGWVFKHAFQQFSKKGWISKERNIFFNWRSPLSKKPSAEAFAQSLGTPVSFLVGGRDRLIPPQMSQQVYQQIDGEKSWLELKEGYHAEALIHPYRVEFKNWLRSGLLTAP